MPRLQGERSNAAIYTVLGLLLLALAAVLALDYFGMLALIPNFGR